MSLEMYGWATISLQPTNIHKMFHFECIQYTENLNIFSIYFYEFLILEQEDVRPVYCDNFIFMPGVVVFSFKVYLPVLVK